MAGQFDGRDHHLRLTVTDVQRSREFYTSLLGFQVAVESPPDHAPGGDEAFKILFGGVVMIQGNLLMGLRPMAPAGDAFDPDRVGQTAARLTTRRWPEGFVRTLGLLRSALPR